MMTACIEQGIGSYGFPECLASEAAILQPDGQILERDFLCICYICQMDVPSIAI